MTVVSDLVERARLVSRAAADYGGALFHPTIRLGITGLSRAGKTVFITALVHALLRGGHFPVFEAWSSGRIARGRLAPQRNDAVPRFDYESYIRALTEDRVWPDSTQQISELRLVIEYQSQNGAMRELTLDIVDYPGEWLLDLPLLRKSYEDWAADSLALSRQPPRAGLAAAWHRQLATLDPNRPEDQRMARTAAQSFTDYLRACRDERFAMSLLPPGRFLMPGDLAGSPALTFAPLDLRAGGSPPAGSLWAMMRRRYEAYKDVVVRPFFRDHFAQIDRQIVLVDTLAALNAGPDALRDLENALATILECFDVGKNNFLRALFAPRIDRILFAATKADHLHHSSHDRLERILSRMVGRATERARFSGAVIDVAAIAALRATREAQVKSGGNQLPSIIGTPAAAERLGKVLFDGKTEAVIYPGDLPEDAGALFKGESAFKGLAAAAADDTDYRFLRFRPPLLDAAVDGSLPHIRLDRTLQFLLGDRLR